MTLFTIDEKRCRKDGICAAECPMGIIAWQKGQIPVPVKGARDMCIACGHCVSACPHEALSLDTMTPADCLPVDPAMALSREQAEHFLRARRSVRNFKEESIDRKTLAELIRVASHAPSGHNSQPVYWQVLSGREVIRPYTTMVIDWMSAMIAAQPEMAAAMHLDMIVGAWNMGMDVVTRNAPNLILATGKAANPMAPDACKIAMTYLDMAAQSFGVGTCWCGYFYRAALSHDPLKQALGLGNSMKVHGVMMAGYPRNTYRRMPPRQSPRIAWVD